MGHIHAGTWSRVSPVREKRELALARVSRAPCVTNSCELCFADTRESAQVGEPQREAWTVGHGAGQGTRSLLPGHLLDREREGPFLLRAHCPGSELGWVGETPLRASLC